MVFTTLTTLLLTAGAVSAQSTSSSSNATATSSAAVSASTAAIPSCALTCTLSSLGGTPCEDFGVSNLTCICTSTEFQLAYYNCQVASCSTTDLAAAEAYGASVCEQNGTPINITATPSGYTGVPSSTSLPSSVSSALSSASASGSSAARSASGTTGPAASASATGTANRNAYAGAVAVLAGLGAVVAGAF